MEHKLQMMEQQMMDMGALHQRDLSAQRHLSLPREWQHRNTMLRMQKEMEEMKQTMLKMQEMLKMKSKRKNLRLETVVEDAEGKSYEGNEGAEGMGKSYEKAEEEGNCYELYAIGEVSK